jgi:hypothetical protein
MLDTAIPSVVFVAIVVSASTTETRAGGVYYHDVDRHREQVSLRVLHQDLRLSARRSKREQAAIQPN